VSSSSSEAAGGVAHEAEAGPDQVEADEPRDHRIEPRQAGENHQAEADGGGDARPEIGEDVRAVGDQGERVVLAARLQQVDAKHRVGEAGADGDEQADVDLPHLVAEQQRLAGFLDDDHRRERYEAALERSAEELDLAVAVGMIAISRPARDDEAAQPEQRGDDIDDALERVGQDRRRAGELVGEILQAEQKVPTTNDTRPARRRTSSGASSSASTLAALCSVTNQGSSAGVSFATIGAFCPVGRWGERAGGVSER
jgi:hypothetical protein